MDCSLPLESIDLSTKTAHIVQSCRMLEDFQVADKDLLMPLSIISSAIGHTLVSLLRYVMLTNTDKIGMDVIKRVQQFAMNKRDKKKVIKQTNVNQFDHLATTSIHTALYKYCDFKMILAMSGTNRSIYIVCRKIKSIMKSRRYNLLIVNRNFAKRYYNLHDKSILLLLFANQIVIDFRFIDNEKFKGFNEDDDDRIETSSEEFKEIKNMMNNINFNSLIKRCIHVSMLNAGLYALSFDSFRNSLVSPIKQDKPKQLDISIESLNDDIFGSPKLKKMISDALKPGNTAAIKLVPNCRVHVIPTGSFIYDLQNMEKINCNFSSLLFNWQMCQSINCLDLCHTPIFVDNTFDMFHFLKFKNVQTLKLPKSGYFNWTQMIDSLVENELHSDYSKKLKMITNMCDNLSKPCIRQLFIDLTSNAGLLLNIFDEIIQYDGQITNQASVTAATWQTYIAFHTMLNTFKSLYIAQLKFTLVNPQNGTSQYFNSVGNIFYGHTNIIPTDEYTFYNLTDIIINFEKYITSKCISVDNVFDRIKRDVKSIINGFYRSQTTLHKANVSRPKKLSKISAFGTLLYKVKYDPNTNTIPNKTKNIDLSFKYSPDSKKMQENRKNPEGALGKLTTSWCDESKISKLPKLVIPGDEKNDCQGVYTVEYNLKFLFPCFNHN